ncbi:transposase [Streptomyces sp. NPDC005507]|uniref:transposase n=1 Tax=unclassified Streptomyces TaxID=2593676 RepID=UPI0033A0A934
MGSKSNRSRRYSEEFKRDAVALVRSSGKTVTEVAREIGVSAEGLGTGSSRTRPTGAWGLRAR